VPAFLSGRIHVGGGVWDGQVAGGVMDELRISDVPRLGNGGPYEVDEHTLLLLHLDGSYNGAQGQAGTANGTSFAAGRFGQGVAFDAGDSLTFGSAGLSAPAGVTTYGDDSIVVADTGNNRVALFSTEGTLLREYLQPNDGYTGAFHAPRGVAVEPDGDLVVADTGNHRVVMVRRALPAPWSTYLPFVSRD